MPDAPQDRSTTTTRRSPDVVGSRPPQLDRGRALRRAAVLLVVIVAVGLVLVLRDDDGPAIAGPAADDPVTALCRSSSDQESAACAAAFFACRDHRTRIIGDATLPATARPRRIVAAYVAGDWGDWDAPVRGAARRGCRTGLKADPGRPARAAG